MLTVPLLNSVSREWDFPVAWEGRRLVRDPGGEVVVVVGVCKSRLVARGNMNERDSQVRRILLGDFLGRVTVLDLSLSFDETVRSTDFCRRC